MRSVVVALAVVGLVFAAPPPSSPSLVDDVRVVPPTNCTPAMNAFCNSAALAQCIDIIHSKGGVTPLVALDDVTSQPHSEPAWRCYSPSTLNANKTAYNATSSMNALFCTERELETVCSFVCWLVGRLADWLAGWLAR